MTFSCVSHLLETPRIQVLSMLFLPIGVGTGSTNVAAIHAYHMISTCVGRLMFSRSSLANVEASIETFSFICFLCFHVFWHCTDTSSILNASSCFSHVLYNFTYSLHQYFNISIIAIMIHELEIIFKCFNGMLFRQKIQKAMYDYGVVMAFMLEVIMEMDKNRQVWKNNNEIEQNVPMLIFYY